MDEDRRKRFSTGEYSYLPMSSPDYQTSRHVAVPRGHDVFEEPPEDRRPHRQSIATRRFESRAPLQVHRLPVPARILNTPTMMLVAEGDDITIWDAEIESTTRIPPSKKRLFVVDHTTHMVLYSNRSQLEIAADQGARWSRSTSSPPRGGPHAEVRGRETARSPLREPPGRRAAQLIHGRTAGWSRAGHHTV